MAYTRKHMAMPTKGKPIVKRECVSAREIKYGIKEGNLP
mgnify:CR=1 FL=1